VFVIQKIISNRSRDYHIVYIFIDLVTTNCIDCIHSYTQTYLMSIYIYMHYIILLPFLAATFEFCTFYTV